jgi:predicted nuclease with RNAse H fold
MSLYSGISMGQRNNPSTRPGAKGILKAGLQLSEVIISNGVTVILSTPPKEQLIIIIRYNFIVQARLRHDKRKLAHLAQGKTIRIVPRRVCPGTKASLRQMILTRSTISTVE